MPVISQNGRISFVKSDIALIDYPKLLAKHANSDSKTTEIEEILRDYVRDGFPVKKTSEVVRLVCHWGNYAGNWGKVNKFNEWADVSEKLKGANSASRSGTPKRAIEIVTSICGLGVSFGSKHLKFMHPEGAVVLDSIISARLGYPLTSDGYEELLIDCSQIRAWLNGALILTPANTKWRVSDVEMAIFASLRK